ncbi:hypothetical protein HanIR_Chr10g0480641 [Helianthus annuus]|nr:hypothetical protein HanIR_Chr10g0480641 [Helianthus annuus]
MKLNHLEPLNGSILGFSVLGFSVLGVSVLGFIVLGFGFSRSCNRFFDLKLAVVSFLLKELDVVVLAIKPAFMSNVV